MQDADQIVADCADLLAQPRARRREGARGRRQGNARPTSRCRCGAADRQASFSPSAVLRRFDCSGLYPSFSVFRNAMMSASSCAVIAGVSPRWRLKGGSADIDIGVILRRNVVVFLHLPVGADRIDLLRIGVAEIVEIHHLLQRVEHAVVEEHAAHGGVAQGRRLEHAAELRLVGNVLANGSANPEIEIVGILGVRERDIARRAQRFILSVGKQRRPSVAAGLRTYDSRRNWPFPDR